MKILNSRELTTAIEVARRRGFNRVLEDVRILEKLDPNGIHTIADDHMQTDVGGVPVVRCHIFMKFRGDDEPHEGWLDIELHRYNNYQSYEETPSLGKMQHFGDGPQAESTPPV